MESHQPTHLNGRALPSVTVSHQEASPRDSVKLAPPERNRTHRLSSTVRNEDISVLRDEIRYPRNKYKCISQAHRIPLYITLANLQTLDLLF